MRLLQPGDQFGRYRIDRVVGQGGMGVVYAAHDTRLDRVVAIKVITGPLATNEDFLRRFREEAAVLARLDSPYVVTIHDNDEVDGLPSIVMQYVEGTDLATFVGERGPLPVRAALGLCAQVARGLGDAHARGVVHRDVKPTNILLRSPGTPEVHAYLCDFGIARSDDTDGRTATGMVAGTWAYLAPERTQGAPASPASDLYALGCVLWVCLTGAQPYQGSDVEMAIAHAQAPVPQLTGTDDFTRDLNGVLARLMAKDPAARYPDASAARADLERLAAHAPDAPVPALPAPATEPGGPTTVRAAAPYPPPPQPQPATAPAATAAAPRSRRWPLAVAAVLVLAVTGGGVASWVARSGDDPAGATDDAAGAGIEGDVDGDGLGDVVVHQERYDAVSPLSVWTLHSSGMNFGAPTRTPALDGNAQLGDVDGDGIPDQLWTPAVAESESHIDVTVVPGDGSDTWTTEIPVDESSGLADASYVVGDADGDGKDDLLIGGTTFDETDGMYVATSTGSGFDAPAIWARNDYAKDDSSLDWTGDFDGDGTDEVLLWVGKGKGPDRMQILAANGDSYEPEYDRPLYGAANSPSISWWVVGDVDGNGDDEIVSFPATGRRVLVYDVTDEGIGKIQPWLETKLTDKQAYQEVHNRSIRAYAISDVDGDGDGDVVEFLASKDEEFPIQLLVSDGSAFAKPVPWGSLPCGSECDDQFSVVY